MDIAIYGNRAFQVIAPQYRTRQTQSTRSANEAASAGLEEKVTRTAASRIAAENSAGTAQVNAPAQQLQPADPAEQSRQTEQLLRQMKDTAIPSQLQLQFRQQSSQTQPAATPAAYGRMQVAEAAQAAEYAPRQIDTVI